MEHRESSGDAAPRVPDGPPPAREQLPLPRRTQQAHIEPQLRARGGAGTGTPFAAFGSSPAEPPDRTDRFDRAAAFHDGTRLGRGGERPRRSAARWPEPGPTRSPEY